ncbi:MAG: PTS sugar transporter subunit IIA [bacterium]
MPRPAKTVSVGRLLKPEGVIFFKGNSEKAEILEKLSRTLAEFNPGLDSQKLLEKIMEREAGISTVLDTGLAIPHARLEGIDDFKAVLGLIPAGYQDPKQPGLTVKAVFLFLSPNNSGFFKRHLQLLTALSSLFQPALIDCIISMDQGPQVVETVLSAE